MQDCFPDTGSHYVVITMGMFTPVVVVMVFMVVILVLYMVVILVILTGFRETHSDSRAVCVSFKYCGVSSGPVRITQVRRSECEW